MLWQAFGRWGGLQGTSEGGGGIVTDPHWDNVVLLLSGNGADGSTTFTDESPVARGNAAITGNAQVDTAQAKFGTGALFLDGSGDFISFADSADWTFGGTDEFTVEAWIRRPSIANMTVISHTHLSFDKRSWLYNVATTGSFTQHSTTGGAGSLVTTSATGGPTVADTWYHVAFDCDASRKLRIYTDGVMLGSRTSFPALHNTDSNLIIGATGEGVTGVDHFHGWMNEIRITKGVARYASDSGYTPPTGPFPRS
jgi:hypothetical protein